jgi:PadR family transcriptional regulator PadR
MPKTRPALSGPTLGERGVPRGYLRACVLLLVAESPTHGYELLDRLRELGYAKRDPGALYRSLRGLEEDGLLESWWEPAASGPARRRYRATPAGRGCLEDMAEALAERNQQLSAYLQRHRDLDRRPAQPALGGGVRR